MCRWIDVRLLLIAVALLLADRISSQRYALWVLDNADSNFSTAPFDDTLTVLDADGSTFSRTTGINISQGIGGWRNLSVSPDGLCALVAGYDVVFDTTTFSGSYTSIPMPVTFTR